MKHRARVRKLGRTSAHRMAMLRNMVTSLLQHERIQTTDAKAKEVRRVADRMITLGKRGDLHARRRALRVIRQREVAAKVFDELADRYRDRRGGYTRVVKLRRRAGDAAPVSIVELVAEEATAPAKKGRRKKAAPAKAAEARPERKKAPAKKPAAKKPAAKKKAAAKPASGKKAARKTGATRKSRGKSE
jgi:large subunit ribosomal protein L17